MALSLSNVNTRNRSSRVPCMLSLPPIDASICTASNKLCDEHRKSIASHPSTVSPRTTPESPPLCASRELQPCFRRARFCASPAEPPVSVHSGGISVHDVNDSVLKVVPNALVAHVHDDFTPEVSSMIPIESSLDFANAFKNSSPSFILVDNCSQCANLTIEMLRDQAGRFDGAVIIVLVQQDESVDFGPIVAKVPEFMYNGADEILLLQHGATDISLSIVVSLAKARANRDQRMMVEKQFEALEKQCEASKKQCDKLFWRGVHDMIPAFPKIRPHLHEVFERCVGDMALVCKLGEGSYGSVYKWEAEMWNKSGAVKVFDKSKISSFGETKQLATEIAVLQRLKHDNVVTFSRAVHGMECVYLFMELAGVSNLFNVIRVEGARGLPWSRAGGFFSQIAAGVAHCHKMQVAHCDLKPENVVISEVGCAKIVDFGQAVDLAKDVAPLQGPKGTMPFTAPEILCSCPDWIPPASDVWSLAVIVVEMFCGNHAFVNLLGWHTLGKELTNPSRFAQCADELKVFFGKDETNVLGKAIMAMSCLCREVPPPLVLDLLDRMFAYMPKERILAESVAECIENISA